jgi:glycosyltransferase involved in cell wall biosynthesis
MIRGPRSSWEVALKAKAGDSHRPEKAFAGDDHRRREVGSKSMAKPKKRVAILSPIAWRTPPRQYGAWETVASNITEGLVARGWDVTLFASRDSVTRARLHAVVDKGYEEDPAVDPKVAEYLHISEAFERAEEFDLIHSHYDFMALTYTRLVKTPVLTTIHGFSSAKIMPVYHKYRDGYFVSISDSDRAAGLNYLATVYNGIDLSLYPLQQPGGDDLVFLGRIHPDKGVHLAIEVAQMSGMRLVIAGIIQDEAYFRERIQPHLDDQKIVYIGPVGVPEKNELFARARALLHLNTIPERFGLVLTEANAAGVPVIAMDLGSCREVIKDCQTGFLVDNVTEAVRSLRRISEINRRACRDRVRQYFSIDTMVEGYERVYSEIFDLEAKRAQSATSER